MFRNHSGFQLEFINVFYTYVVSHRPYHPWSHFYGDDVSGDENASDDRPQKWVLVQEHGLQQKPYGHDVLKKESRIVKIHYTQIRICINPYGLFYLACH